MKKPPDLDGFFCGYYARIFLAQNTLITQKFFERR